MKRSSILATAATVFLAMSQTAAGQGYIQALIGRDLEALGEFFSEQSDTINYDGQVCKGWKEIRAHFKKEFATRKGTFQMRDFWSIRPLSEDINLSHGIWETTGYEEGEEPDVTQAIYATILNRETRMRLCFREMVPLTAIPGKSGSTPNLAEIGGVSDAAAVKIANQLNAEFIAAIRGQDGASLAKTFTDDGAYRNERGGELIGPAAIRLLQRFFEQNPSVSVEFKTNSARFLTPEILITDGVTKRSGYPEGRPERCCFFRVSVNKDGEWLTKLLMVWVPYVSSEESTE